MNNAIYISVIIPVFNEENDLMELYDQLCEALNGIHKGYEVIFIDDGSIDRSPGILNSIKQSDSNIIIISFIRNFGQHAAVMAGFKAARGQIVVTLDADLQNPPHEIPKLIREIEKGYDVASGRRIHRRDFFLRKLLSFMMNKIISGLTGVKLMDYGCMLRAYKKPLVELIVKYGEKSVYIPAFASWLSSNVLEVPVTHNSRKHGKSRYNFLKFLRQMFDLVTAYTLLPIQLISIVGVIFSVLGVLLAAYLMIYRFFLGTTSTLTTFIAALLLFSGLIIFFMGIISEYLVRMYIESRKKPFYIIKEGSDESGWD